MPASQVTRPLLMASACAAVERPSSVTILPFSRTVSGVWAEAGTTNNTREHAANANRLMATHCNPQSA